MTSNASGPACSPEVVAERARKDFDATLARLVSYLKIPAISCEPEHHRDVKALAERLRSDLEGLGLTQCRVLELPDALPLVVADYAAAGPDKPTILIYGHLDLQPVEGEPWSTPPHEAVIKGERLYARGAADDMGGWVSHLAAMQAWLDVAGQLPVNVRLVIEGEEEIGSPNLERYMDEFPGVFTADAMVLTDCENPAVDVPGLTVSLRGLLEVKVTCEALASDVHSGLWGNMAPDPATSLVLLLSRLLDEQGRLKVGRQEVPAEFRKQSANAPPDRETIVSGARLLPGVEPLPLAGASAAEWLWRQPAVTILSTTLPRPGSEKNAIRAQASATLSVRLAPGQTSDEMLSQLREVLLREPPGKLRVRVEKLPGAASSWLYEPTGPAFEAADRAYEKGFGCKLQRVGIGGSIPFVALFARRFSHLPLILNGVMDPQTGAHGPDESMHLGVFEKAIVTNVYLLDELSRVRFEQPATAAR